MVRRDSNDWAVWCNHVLMELERLNEEVKCAKNKAIKAWLLAMLIQAQLFVGGVALGYLIKVLVDHIQG